MYLNEKIKLKRYSIMKNLPTLEEVNNLILDSFLELSDDGFHIESCHQNGYSSYVIYNPNLIYFNLDNRSNLIEVDEDFEKNMEIFLSSLSRVYYSFFYNKERIINTQGLENFDLMNNSARLDISFRHQPQGYGNLGTNILVGNKKMIYH